ncbi:hypothetical protein E2P81_ATG03829 [Venturia nashicola]|nr:hypothetical protein E2P81_ATG03829 [Venturia nashicola]
MSSKIQKSACFINVSRRVKSKVPMKGGPKPWRTNKAGRLPHKAVKPSPIFMREYYDNETIWTFTNGHTISVLVLDPNDFVREGRMIDDDRAMSLENWTHLHEKNPLPTSVQRAQGAINLDRLRLDLLASTEGGRLHFLNPEVMLRKDSNGVGNYLMNANAADGENVVLPDHFASADPSPLANMDGLPFARGTVVNHRRKCIETNKYVEFGDFETLAAYVGPRNSVPVDVEPEPLAADPKMVGYDIDMPLEQPAVAQHEEYSEQLQTLELPSMTTPSWDPFADDFFEDDDEEILRLEQERLDEVNLAQAPQVAIDADRDTEMTDYVEEEGEEEEGYYDEPEPEVEVRYYDEPESEVVSEEARITELMQYDWYHAHLKARDAGLVRQETATTPAEANYIIGSSQGPATELLQFVRDVDDDSYSTIKWIGTRPENGGVIMGDVKHDSMRRFVLLLNGAGHFRECFDLYEAFNIWPNNVHGEPLVGSKVPWVPASMAKHVEPNFSFRLSYPRGTRGRDKNEPLDEDLYRESSRIRNFSKMRDIWTVRDGLMVEENWSDDNLQWWKSEEDRRRFPKVQFGTIGVTPEDRPKAEETPKTEAAGIERMPVREFGYSDGATAPNKYHFGDFIASTLDDLAVESEIGVDEEADEEGDHEPYIEKDHSLQELLVKDSMFIDEEKWLADVQGGITEELAKAARDSSPFQEVPDEEAQPLATLRFESQDADDESGDTEAGTSENNDPSPGLVLDEEQSLVEGKFPSEVTKEGIPDVYSRGLFIFGPKGCFEKIGAQEPQPAFDPEAKAIREEELCQVESELSLLFEQPPYGNTIKNFGHKRIPSDRTVHTESTEDESSGSSPPTSDDGHAESEKQNMDQQDFKSIEGIAEFYLQTAPVVEDLTEEVNELDEDLTEEDFSAKEGPIKAPSMAIEGTSAIEPGLIAMGTAWMMADPVSFFTVAGVGLLAWASQDVLRKI